MWSTLVRQDLFACALNNPCALSLFCRDPAFRIFQPIIPPITESTITVFTTGFSLEVTKIVAMNDFYGRYSSISLLIARTVSVMRAPKHSPWSFLVSLRQGGGRCWPCTSGSKNIFALRKTLFQLLRPPRTRGARFSSFNFSHAQRARLGAGLWRRNSSWQIDVLQV